MWEGGIKMAGVGVGVGGRLADLGSLDAGKKDVGVEIDARGYVCVGGS